MNSDKKEIKINNDQSFTIDNDKLFMNTKILGEEYTYRCSLVITKEVFQECYNRWIKPQEECNSYDKKTGHWTLDETDNSVTCDNCGCTIYPNDIINGEPHFCTNCGLEMKG